MRGTFEEPPTRFIPWFSKTEGNTYATIVASSFPLQGKPTQAQDVANVSREVVLIRACLHIMDLWLECSIGPVVLGTLFGIMSGLSTTVTRIVAQAILQNWVEHVILDLGGGLVNILLPIGLVCYLSRLPGTSLLHWLHFLLGLKLALVIVMGRLII